MIGGLGPVADSRARTPPDAEICRKRKVVWAQGCQSCFALRKESHSPGLGGGGWQGWPISSLFDGQWQIVGSVLRDT